MRSFTASVVAGFALAAQAALAQTPVPGRFVKHEVYISPVAAECGSTSSYDLTDPKATIPVNVSCRGRSFSGTVVIEAPATTPAGSPRDQDVLGLQSPMAVSLQSKLTTTAPAAAADAPYTIVLTNRIENQYQDWWRKCETVRGVEQTASTTRTETLDLPCSVSDLRRSTSAPGSATLASYAKLEVGNNKGPILVPNVFAGVWVTSHYEFAEVAPLAITPSVAPNTVEPGFFEEPLKVTITGKGFQQGATVDFGDIGVDAVRFIDSGKLEADLRGFRDLSAGDRSFEVVNPDGTRMKGTDLFYVSNLYIPEIEINQGVPMRCRAGDPPCVANHDTTIRVGLRCKAAWCGSAKAWLHVLRDGTPLPSSPFEASPSTFSVPTVDQALDRTARKALRDAMNFEFGESRSLREGVYEFVFEIDPRKQAVLPDRSQTPDTSRHLIRRLGARTFLESRPTESIHVAVLLDGSLHPNLRSRLFAEIGRWSSFVPIAYPISRDFVSFEAINDPSVGGFASEGEAFARLRNWYEAQRQAGSGYSHVVLLHQSEMSTGGVSDCMFPWGMQWCSTPTALIRMDGTEEAVIAHEIGHHYGLGDTYIEGGLEGNNNPWSDACRFFGDGCPVEEGHVDTGRREMSVYVPNSDSAVKAFVKRDVMGNTFREDRWIDRRSWDYLHARLMPSAAGKDVGASAAGDWITVTGTVRANGTGELSTVWVPPEASGTESMVGDFTVALRDAGGAVLRSVDFPATFRYADSKTTQTAMPFSVTLAKPAGAKRAVLLRGSVELDSLALESGAPQVTVEYPNGGESLSGTATIRWAATDPEGDALRFNVFYEAGEGRRLPLATMISGTSLEWNTAQSPGTSVGKITVFATDGVNHVSDSSNAAFNVASGGPVAAISDPDDQAVVEAGWPVTFRGGAYDFDDGEISGAALTFSSSRDGVLGTGPVVTAVLSAGAHQITLTARDRDGKTATDTVALTAYTPISIRRILPSAGSLQGSLGSFFKTGVQLHNPTAGPIAGRFVYHPAGASAAPGDSSLSFSLAPGATTYYPDLLPGMAQSGLGSIDLVTTLGAPPVSAVRIFNDAGARGTSGMTEPQIDPARVLKAGDQTMLILPPDPARARFNIGIRTLDNGGALYPTLLAADGTHKSGLGKKSYPPNYFVQFPASDWFAPFGKTFDGTDVIRISVAEGELIIYGVATDNTTQDPSLQFATAQPALGAKGERKIIPVVGSLPGNFGSYFRTELQFHNAQNRAVRVRIDYRESLSGTIRGSLEFDIINYRSHYIPDLLPAMGIASGIGTAEITAISAAGGLPGSVVRIFNDAGAAGTSGMTQDAVAPADALQPGESGVLLAPPDPARARFNIGVRALDAGCSMLITVRDRGGNVRGTVSKTFGANFFEQKDAPTFLGIVPLASDSLTFTVNSGSAIVYGSTVDNVTQDPSLQYAQN